MKIAIMGYGTIGSGVARVITDNRDLIRTNVGEELDIKYILDLRDFPEDPHKDAFTKDVNDIINDPEVKVVVETMGGLHPAFEFVSSCLKAGKSVTTSNKALVADYGVELQRIARENHAGFLCEASVGGGIPIIRTLDKCLTADEIVEISGIVNGTTNYMLTEMAEKGTDFDTVLRQAQDLGYAEKDPTADVEGYDAARKIAILTSIISHHKVDFNDVPTEGITKISPIDIKYANNLGRAIKLIATAKKESEGYSLRVAPFMVEKTNPLYFVNGAFNAIFVVGNMLGDSMYYGSGAGSLPTASAVCADVVALAKNINEPDYEFCWDDKKADLLDSDRQKNSFFIRSTASESDIKNLIPGVKIIESLAEGETAFVTGEIEEKELAGMENRMGTVLQKIRLK